MSLLELAFLNEGKQRLNFRLEEVFRALDTNPAFRIIPLTTKCFRSRHLATHSRSRRPRNVATARVHRLRLPTADSIIESALVPVRGSQNKTAGPEFRMAAM
jgi:hypothetical protein